MKRSVKLGAELCVIIAVLVGMAVTLSGVVCALSAQQAYAQDSVSSGGAPAGDSGVYPPAPAQPQQQSQGFGTSFMNLLPLLLACMLIFHFMVLKPQEAKAKAHKELMESLKKGEEVTTSSGIIGRVATLEKDIIGLDIAPSVRIRVERAHIVKRFEAGIKASAA